MRTLIAAPVLAAFLVVASGCAFMGMDSFEPWEVAQSDYLSRLPPEHRDSFRSDRHAIAYALGAECFESMEPQTPRDEAVRTACRDSAGVVLSQIMTLEDFCQDLRADRDAGADVPDGLFCR